MQDARENFRKVRYTVALGVQGYYDALLEQAQNMAVYPDEYTILEEFVKGLPQAMLSRCFREHRITVEANSLEDWVAAAREIERCDRNESYYRDISRTKTDTPSQLKETPRTTNKTFKWGANKQPQSGMTERNAQTTANSKGTKPYAGKPYQDKPKPATGAGRTTDRSRAQYQAGRPFDRSKVVGPRSVTCFQCGGPHFVNQCDKPPDRREFVRAARTTA